MFQSCICSPPIIPLRTKQTTGTGQDIKKDLLWTLNNIGL